MLKLVAVMKHEIQRLARKEIRSETKGLKKDLAALLRKESVLRRQFKAQDASLRTLLRSIGRKSDETSAAGIPDNSDKLRITSKGVKTLRKKLRLSQAEFGRLAGVTNQAVLRWEHKSGTLRIWPRVRKALLEMRKMGVREARSRLEKK